MRAEDVLRAVDNGVYSLLPAWRPAVNRLFRADGAQGRYAAAAGYISRLGCMRENAFLMAGMEKLEKMYINQGWYQDGDFGRSLAYRFCGQPRVSAGRAVRLPV